MNHGSLFSGIGGFDLAAEWMGWNNIFNCEWEEFPRKVLKHHFPNAEQHEDIREFDATAYAGRIDILSGGFPCQPYSVAGLRKGKEDERHLWPEMLRIIRECKPRWVVGENVRGLVNWSEGLVFEEVCVDLETCGYSVQPFILPAAGVGNCPHRRDRVWFVAKNTNCYGRGGIKWKEESNTRRFRDVSAGNNERIRANYDEAWDASNTKHNGQPSTEGGRSNGTDSERSEKGQEVPKQFKRVREPEKLGSVYASNTDSGRRNAGSKCEHDHNGKWEVCKDESNDRNEIWSKSRSGSLHRNATNTDSTSRTGERINRQRQGEFVRRSSDTISDRWKNFPTVPHVCGGDDGLPQELDGITFSKWRKESIKAYGNAIVPQVALQIFKAIEQYENMNK